jgi:release factor glutamine methyltransferase
LEQATVLSIDISKAALAVAKKNVAVFKAPIELKCMDFLDEKNWHELPKINIIVSNPPYIKLSEKENMMQHVVDYEPSLALFVPDNDPLVFYKKILAFGKRHYLFGDE